MKLAGEVRARSAERRRPLRTEPGTANVDGLAQPAFAQLDPQRKRPHNTPRR